MSVTSRAQLRLDGEPRSALCGMPHNAERGVRPTKTQQKISGRLTSEDTTQDRLDIRSYIDTARKHGRRPLDVLRSLFTGNPWRPPVPAQA